MYCPRCRSEYRAGFTRCANCEVDLVAELPAEDTFATPEAMVRALASKDVQAILVGNHVDLSEAQRYLADKRVATVIAGEADENVDTPLHQRFFLMVATEEIERARDMIHERWREGAIAQGLLLSDAEAAEGTCPACGAKISADVSECPDCGLFLGDAEKPAS